MLSHKRVHSHKYGQIFGRLIAWRLTQVTRLNLMLLYIYFYSIKHFRSIVQRSCRVIGFSRFVRCYSNCYYKIYKNQKPWKRYFRPYLLDTKDNLCQLYHKQKHKNIFISSWVFGVCFCVCWSLSLVFSLKFWAEKPPLLSARTN